MTDIEIARNAEIRPIREIAKALGMDEDDLELYGKYKAKISEEYLQKIQDRPDGKLVLVTAINPTPAGEGKTTISIGLADALSRLGKKTVAALREPSLGPCFGVKGGAAGGGYAQVIPMEDLNLHFTGDFHAITSANNLLAAAIAIAAAFALGRLIGSALDGYGWHHSWFGWLFDAIAFTAIVTAASLATFTLLAPGFTAFLRRFANKRLKKWA